MATAAYLHTSNANIAKPGESRPKALRQDASNRKDDKSDGTRSNNSDEMAVLCISSGHRKYIETKYRPVPLDRLPR